MAVCWVALYYSSVYEGKLWYFSVVCSYTLLAESSCDTIWVLFRAFSSTVLTAFLASSNLHEDSGALKTDSGPEGANHVSSVVFSAWFSRFHDTQIGSSEGFQIHVADSSCSSSLRDHCDGHRVARVLGQLRRGLRFRSPWSWLVCSLPNVSCSSHFSRPLLFRPTKFVSSFPLVAVCRLQAYKYEVFFVLVNSFEKVLESHFSLLGGPD